MVAEFPHDVVSMDNGLQTQHKCTMVRHGGGPAGKTWHELHAQQNTAPNLTYRDHMHLNLVRDPIIIVTTRVVSLARSVVSLAIVVNLGSVANLGSVVNLGSGIGSTTCAFDGSLHDKVQQVQASQHLMYVAMQR
jgi:hypothetical protein